MTFGRSHQFRSIKRRQSAAKRSLRLESLESRSLLAGDVDVFISGTDIHVQGDGDANEITIEADATDPGRFTITGVNGTAINGTVDDSVVLEGYNLRLTMGAGDDIVTMTGDGGAGSVLPGGLYADLGTSDGPDQLFSLTGGYTVTLGLRVIASAGEDTVTLDDVTARDMFFSTGAGGETISITNSQTTSGGIAVTTGAGGGTTHTIAMDNVDVAKHLDLLLGAGDSNISLQDVQITGNLNIRTGSGEDIIDIGLSSAVQTTGDIYISTGAGNATIDMLEGTARTLSIKTGVGEADIDITTYDIGASLLITNGAGNDIVNIVNIEVGKDISIVNANGNHDISIDSGEIAGFISIQTLGGTQTFDFGSAGLLQTGGSMSVRNGVTGIVTFNAINLDIGNALTVQTGRGGTHVINIGIADGGTVDVARGLAVRSDGGADVTIDNTSVGLDLVVLLGNTNGTSQMFIGQNAPVLVTRTSSFRTGIGDTNINIGALDTGGNFIVQTRSGADNFIIGGISGIGDLFVGGATIISSGLGDDIVDLGADAGAISYFTGMFTCNLGPGDDDVIVGEGVTGDAFFEPYNFTFEGGLGTNSITVTNGTAFDPFDPVIRKRLRNFGTNVFT